MTDNLVEIAQICRNEEKLKERKDATVQHVIAEINKRLAGYAEINTKMVSAKFYKNGQAGLGVYLVLNKEMVGKELTIPDNPSTVEQDIQYESTPQENTDFEKIVSALMNAGYEITDVHKETLREVGVLNAGDCFHSGEEPTGNIRIICHLLPGKN